ncbi:hypothetical protein CW304_19235 [Bacillus sp. UFRGS-B20]|nr:hypothetical protein CW304_19235 [Bacillus sp. UFRGS-B20]
MNDTITANHNPNWSYMHLMSSFVNQPIVCCTIAAISVSMFLLPLFILSFFFLFLKNISFRLHHK